jgi:succinate-semialdehyde dehydrogenase / glutarate-semialdehyde dehydrogenase
MSYQTVNPFTGNVVRDFAQHTDVQVAQAVTKAAMCFEIWKQTSFATRSDVLKRAAKLLRLRSDEFAALITLEMGKLIAESRGEVALSADIIEYYAENAEQFLAPHIIPRDSGEAMSSTHPSECFLA